MHVLPFLLAPFAIAAGACLAAVFIAAAVGLLAVAAGVALVRAAFKAVGL